MKKRVLSWILTVCMMLSLLPIGALAAGERGVWHELQYYFSGAFSDVVTTGESIVISGCENQSVQTLTIPAFIHGYPVTAIEDGAFGDCKQIETVVIPHTVREIWYNAFGSCPKIRNVYYSGTRAEWEQIEIGSGNATITNIDNIHFAAEDESLLTEEFIRHSFFETMDIYNGVFLFQNDVDHTDVVKTDEYFGEYYRVRQADSLEAFRACFRQHLDSGVVGNLTDGLDPKWKEQNGKLYVARAYGLGGPSPVSAEMTVRRDSPVKYSVEMDVVDDAGIEGNYTIHLLLQDGHWVWDNVLNLASDFEITKLVLDFPRQEQLYTVERVDRSVTRTKESATAKVITYYDLVQLKPEACANAQQINELLRSHMEERFARGQSYIDYMQSNFEDLARIQKNGEIPWKNYYQLSQDHTDEGTAWNVYLGEDVLSFDEEGYDCVDPIDTEMGHGLMYAFFHDCVTIDLETGRMLTLPEYLGLPDSETKQLLQDALTASKFPKAIWERYLQNTDPAAYKFVVDASGEVFVCFDSDEITYTEQGAPALSLGKFAPRIITQPQDFTGGNGAAVTFTVRCYGANLQYQWQFSTDDGQSWLDLDGETGRTLSRTLQYSDNGECYRCVVSGEGGSTESRAAKVTVVHTEATYAQAHLDFVNSQAYRNILNYAWAYEIANGLNNPRANVAENLHDLLNSGAELFGGEKLSIFNNSYEAIVTDLILAQTGTKVEDFSVSFYEKELQYISWLDEMLVAADPSWAIRDAEYSNILEELLQPLDQMDESGFEFLASHLQNARVNDFLHFEIKSYQKIGGFLDKLNSYADVVNWVAECIRICAYADAYLETSEEFKLTLRDAEIAMSCMAANYDNQTLQECYRDFKACIDQYNRYMTADSLVPELVKQCTEAGAFTATSIFSDTIKKNAALFLEKCGVGAATWIYAAIEAYRFGWSISEGITQNGDIMDCKKLSRSYYYLEDALLTVVQNRASKLRENPTFDNALNFDAGYTVLQQVENGAIKNYIKQLQVQEASLVHSIKNGGLLDPHFNFAEECTCTAAIAEWNNTPCHEGEAPEKRDDVWSISIVSVCCPTDVTIYDKHNQKVCFVENDQITVIDRNIIANDIDSEKFFVIPNLDDYRIEISATDDGEMSYLVWTRPTDQTAPVHSAEYYSVPLRKGNVYQSVTDNLDTELSQQGSAVSPQYRNGDPVLPFVDVPKDAYYTMPVSWAVNHDPQVTNGVDATHFAPDANCTRGQMVTFLWRAAGKPAPKSASNPFRDVKSGAYYYNAVLWAVEKGITNGTSPTTFSPDATVTRAQTVTFLWRMEGEPKEQADNPFRDVSLGEYYGDAVLWAVKNEITNGTSQTTFSPNNPCTRAQIVTLLYRDLAARSTVQPAPENEQPSVTPEKPDTPPTPDVPPAEEPTPDVPPAEEPKPETCRVTFDACGGAASETAREVPLGEAVGALPEAAREGFVFQGWHTAPDGGERVVSAAPMTDRNGCTLYARWTPLAAILDGGSFGDGMAWKLDENGLLVISGAGSMPDYAYKTLGDRPWSPYLDEIKQLIIEEGVTRVGACCFYGCPALTSYGELPESLVQIGEWGFYGCTALTEIEIGPCVERLDDSAFSTCSSLRRAVMSDSVTDCKFSIFFGCDRLTDVRLSENLRKLGDGFFWSAASNGTTDLRRLVIPASVTEVRRAFYNSGVQTIIFCGSAPSFTDDAFQRVTATVWYPKGDPTWEQAIGSTYKGTVTWAAYEGSPDQIG